MGIINYIWREEGVTLAEIRTWTQQRHADYSLLNRTLQQTEREYKAAQNPHKDGDTTAGAGALGSGGQGGAPKSQGGGPRRGGVATGS